MSTKKPKATSHRTEAGLLVTLPGSQAGSPQKFFLEHNEFTWEELIPDPKNPRYRFLMEDHGDGLTPDEMFDVLKNDDATINLAKSIEGVGGLTEPVIVEIVGKQKIIREGIRRWAAYRILREAQVAKGQPITWTTMACHVVPNEMTKKALAVYIGTIHYQGKNPWDGHARAGYIFEMKKEHKMSNDDIAAVFGISKQEVVRSLLAYEHSTKQAKASSNGDGEVQPQYSKFYELLKQPGGKEALQDAKKRAVIYAGVNQVANSKQARDLVKIADNAKASKVITQESTSAYEDAKAIVEQDDPAAMGVFRLMTRATKDLNDGYKDALRFLQKQRGNKGHLEIFSKLVGVVVELAKDSGRTAIIEKALKHRQQRRAAI